MPLLTGTRTSLLRRFAAVLGATVLPAVQAAHAQAPYAMVLDNPSAYRLADDEAFRLAAAFGPTAPAAFPLPDKPYAAEIDHAARREGLDPALVHALIHVESRHNPRALSPKGAVGLMQVLPATGARFGREIRLTAVEDNLRAGTRYLRMLMDMFDQRVDLALAAYNAGEKAVARHGNRIPPYPETRHYVPAVMAQYDAWKRPPVPTRTEYQPGTQLTSRWREIVTGERSQARP